MRRFIIGLLTLTCLILGVAVVRGHDAFQVTGTLSDKDATRLEVTTKDGDKIWIVLPKHAVIKRGQDEVPPSELTVGIRIAVDAMGEDYPNDLEAYEVRIEVPADDKK